MSPSNHLTQSSWWPNTDDAWQFSDDKAQRVKEAEEAAALHLQEFIDAAQKNDSGSRNQMANFTGEIISVLKDGQSNNLKLTDRIQPLVNTIVNLSTGRLRFMRMRSLWFITSAIDGNRDNKSYYRLDSGREWIERRVNHTDAGLKEKLLDAQKTIIDGRDALETMAVTFVESIKTIRAETSKRPGTEDDTVIENMAKQMQESSGNKTILINKTDEAIQKLEAIEKDLRA